MFNSVKELLLICKEKKGVYGLSIGCSIISVLCSITAYYYIYLVCKCLMLRSDAIYPIIGMVISFLLHFSFSAFSSVLSHKATADLLCETRKKITEKMNKVSLGELQKYQSGYYKKLIIDDVESLERFLAHSVPEVSASICGAVLVTTVLFFINIPLAICSVITIPVAFKLLSQMMNGIEEKMGNYACSLENMNSSFIEYIQGMSVIKAYHKEGEMTKNLDSDIEKFRFYVVDWYRSCWKYLSGFTVLMKANLLLLVPISGILFLKQYISIEEILFVILMSFTYTVPMTKLMEFGDTMPMISENFSQIKHYLSLEELKEKDSLVNFDDYSLSFEDVKFGYKEGETAVYNLNFTAEEGKITALVGESGSGKSTTANLAARFFDSQQGIIRVGGVPIQEIPLKQLMNTISFVFQNSFLMEGTLEENIKMGKVDASETEIWEAAKKARCTEILKEKGLDFKVQGNNGMQLSGGEKQRLALCRAILKNAPVLILDEATASLDNENQKEIQEAITELAKNKTVLMIAHRLSTIVDSDQIIVFDKGKIVQKGPHTELIEQKGIYRNLFDNYTKSSKFVLKEQEVM